MPLPRLRRAVIDHMRASPPHRRHARTRWVAHRPAEQRADAGRDRVLLLTPGSPLIKAGNVRCATTRVGALLGKTD